MDQQKLNQFEELCINFSSADSTQRKAAHDALFLLVSDPTSVPQFMAVLAYSRNDQALLFAANVLVQLFTQHWTSIPENQKSELRAFLLNYLYQKGKTLLTKSSETLNALVRLLARVVKLQYLESPANQMICEQVEPFLASSSADWVIGIIIYYELTEDMCPKAGRQSLARARRQALSFRDTSLPTVFKTAIDTLQKFYSGTIVLTANSIEDTRLLKAVLSLSLSCLSFDFMGVLVDESSEDRSDQLMIPSSWTIIRESKIVQLYFGIYKSCFRATTDILRIECARLCLQALVQLAALRRSYFTKDEDRKSHLTDLVNITAEIMMTNCGIDKDNECYHHFCRLLGKINSAIPFFELKAALMEGPEDILGSSENPFSRNNPNWNTGSGMLSRFGGGRGELSSDILISEPSNPKEWSAKDTPLLNWVQSVREFTVFALQRWAYMPNSKHYLMGFWVSLGSTLVLRSHRLESLIESVVVIFKSFIDCLMKIGDANALMEVKTSLGEETFKQCLPFSFCDVAQLAETMEIEDPLNDEVFRTDQLEVVHSLGKLHHVDCLSYLEQYWMQTVSTAMSNSCLKLLTDQRFALLTYLIGAILGGHMPSKVLFTHFMGRQQSASDTETIPNGDITELEKSAGATNNGRKLSSVEFSVLATATKVFDLFTGKTQSFNPSNVSEPFAEPFEKAVIYFMECFKKTFFSDQVSTLKVLTVVKSSQEFLGEDDYISLILKKVLWNLRKAGQSSDALLKRSLELLHSMTTSVVMTSTPGSPHMLIFGRLLLRTPVIQTLISPQGSREAVDCLHPINHGCLRTSLYRTISHTFFLSIIPPAENDTFASSELGALVKPVHAPKGIFVHTEFANYMQPLAKEIAEIWPAGNPQGIESKMNPNSFANDSRDDIQKLKVIAIFRDLRGICQSCLTPQIYNLLFEWLVNRPTMSEYSRLHLLSVALQNFWQDYQVVIPVLRFATELTSKSHNRIAFNPSSPNGIILFREISSVLSSYAPQLLTKSVGASDGSRNETFSVGGRDKIYEQRYKGLALTLRLLANALAGEFSNFGAFQVYGDQALPEALKLGLRICLAVPEGDLQAFPKLLPSYYTFLELMTRTQMFFIMELQPAAIAKLIRILEDGMCFSARAQLNVESCTALANLLKHFISRLSFESTTTEPGPESSGQYPKSEEEAELWRSESQKIRYFLESEPMSLRRVLQLGFQLLLTDHLVSTWSLSPVILCLIILNRAEYDSIKEGIIDQQVGDLRKTM